MLTTTSPSTDEILDGLRAIVGPDRVETDSEILRVASVDRFKKYTAVHGIFDGPFPIAVVSVRSTDEVAAVLEYANVRGVSIVPRTGGTATEGGLETAVAHSILLDGSALDATLDIDETNMTATAQCGVPLRILEEALNRRGLTTGHSPQSKPLAQMGGLVATRSIGQFSTLYGGIEDLVVGLEAVFPDGRTARIKNVPRRAAGPDIRHVIIGNEGALCFITEVTVRVFTHQPQNNRYFGFVMDDFGDAVSALRAVIVAGYRPSVCRAYSPGDAAQHFGDFYDGKSVVVLVAEGPKPIADATAQGIETIFADLPAASVDPQRIEDWFTHLNWGQDKIDAEKQAMLESHHLGYTTEVSIGWSGVGALYDAIIRRVETEFAHADDLTMLGAHSSHSYQTGTNLYFVYDYDISCAPREERTEYHEPLNAIIVEEALRLGGSMVHHHGIGKYRAPWTCDEHGSAFFVLEALKAAFDPNGIMNPGTIYPLDTQRRD